MGIAVIIMLCLFTHPVLSVPTYNITISVPNGTTNDGDPHLICTPTQWTTIVAFFIGNYLTHVATTRSYPGETWKDHVFACILALFFPMVGAGRGLQSIFRFANHPNWPGNNKNPSAKMERDLKKAARAGALCMISRVPEGLVLNSGSDTPFETVVVIQRKAYFQNIRRRLPGADSAPSNYNIPVVRQVQGIPGRLPSGYCLTFVPLDAEVVCPSNEGISISPQTSSSGDALKAGIAILQLMYASLTLYRARGDQISRYGYAAFGLTVLPYAVMSLVNLIGCLATPSYSSMYLVHSKEMDEARMKEDFHCVVVGRLVDESDGKQGSTSTSIGVCKERNRVVSLIRIIMINFVALIVWLSPLAINGALSRFNPGDSSFSQRAWTMTWVLVSWVGLGAYGLWENRAIQQSWKQKISHYLFLVSYCAIYGVPAIGGISTVSKMLIQYGDCVRFG